MSVRSLAFSRLRSAKPPKPFIHGGGALAVPAVLRNLSLRASVKSCFRLTPLAAARVFARRKVESGISRVVFIKPYSHIYGRSQAYLGSPGAFGWTDVFSGCCDRRAFSSGFLIGQRGDSVRAVLR